MSSAEYHREWRKANPELARAIQARYRAAHPERVLESGRRAGAKYRATANGRIVKARCQRAFLRTFKGALIEIQHNAGKRGRPR